MIRLHSGASLEAPYLASPGILAIEVDGVDLGAGLLEGPLLPALIELVSGLALLWREPGHELDLGFAEGSLDLLLARRGEDALLSLVSLQRPARILFQDVSVELTALTDATIGYARSLLAQSKEPAAREASPSSGGRRSGDPLGDRDELGKSREPEASRRGSASSRGARRDGSASAHEAALPSRGRETDLARLEREIAGLLRSRWRGDDAMPRSRRERRERRMEAPAVGPSWLPPLPTPPRAALEIPAFSFDLSDDEGRLHAYEGGSGLHALLVQGHVFLHGPDGEELGAIGGSPFLLLRDLSDSVARLLEPDGGRAGSHPLPMGPTGATLDVDSVGSTFTMGGRTLRCPTLYLARSIFQAALDLGAVVSARNPRLGESPYLRLLVDEARSRMALCNERIGGLSRGGRGRPVEVAATVPGGAKTQPPLAIGALRRVSLRQAWRLELPRISRIIALAPKAWVRHQEGLSLLRLDDGEVEARIPLEPQAEVAVAGVRAPLFVFDRGALTCYFPDGRLAWRRRDPDRLGLQGAVVPAGSAHAWLHDGASLRSVSVESGEERFRFGAPASHRARLAASGALIVLAADNGMLYGFDTKRSDQPLAWRIPLPRRLVDVGIAAGKVYGVSVSPGRVHLDSLQASTGEPSTSLDLPFLRFGSLLPVPGGVVAAGVGLAGGELLRVDEVSAIRWQARPILGPRAPALLRIGGSIFARGDEGLCRIERGKVRWNAPCGSGGAPTLIRGILALPGEPLRLLDAETGHELQMASDARALPTAERVLATRAGTLVVCDAEGSLVGLRMAGAIAVVPDIP